MRIIFILALMLSTTLSCSDLRTFKHGGLKFTVLRDYVKSIDWSERNNTILSAKKGNDGFYDIFAISPDGENEQLLTHNRTGCPQKHNGNPAWHPDARYIAFTALSEDATGTKMEKAGIPGTGFNCNLWIMDDGGTKFWKLTDIKTQRFNCKGVIHPQFSNKGDMIMWSERIGRRGKAAWGEWIIRVADFSVKKGFPEIRNIRSFDPGRRRAFYETHDFSPDDKKIIFSGNLLQDQPENGLDIYEMELESGNHKRLTHTFNDWDEHAHISPNGKRMIWMSSKGIRIYWKEIKGVEWKKYIQTDLWVMNSDGTGQTRLTYFNTKRFLDKMGISRVIISDTAFSPDGFRIAAALVFVGKNGNYAQKLVIIHHPGH